MTAATTAAADDGRPTVRIGVFLPSGAQLLDTACIDIFEMMGAGYLSLLDLLPAAVAGLAPAVSIAYVGTVNRGEPIELTAGMQILCTHHMSDPGVQPGELDIVLVPGPDPRLRWEENVLEWLRGHAKRVGETDILSVCTGIYLCGEAGLLKGRRACGPRGLQNEIKERFEGVTLVGDELRWVRDGNFWSSGKSSVPSHPVSPHFSFSGSSSFSITGRRGAVAPHPLEAELTIREMQAASRTATTSSSPTPGRAATLPARSSTSSPRWRTWETGRKSTASARPPSPSGSCGFCCGPGLWGLERRRRRACRRRGQGSFLYHLGRWIFMFNPQL